ncbi:Multicopper oxidase [Paracoccus isoporae]|uniref:Multicopper oxidase n=1 Tax=Paracoccus isoporae TaxID=591205 RepID=A0A1G7FCJ1_9RHOB|nr:multicopper oxidase domain-containing protein [Paracoccus isoporae]SDE73649.1 Multicopper oxidase [Paracoccus isoporae]
MTQKISRRGVLAAGAAMAASFALPRAALASDGPMTLSATTRVLDIDGRAATVLGLENAAGGQGLTLDPGQRFRADLTNDLAERMIVHWHGQIPPNAQDGVPDMPMPLFAPGETRRYDYAATPGTHWMHSHVPVQEMRLLAAPLIVRRPEDLAADRQEVVMFLHDFSFRTPQEVLAEIRSGAGHDDAMPGMQGAGVADPHAGHDMGGADGAMPGMDMSEMEEMAGMDMSSGAMPGHDMAGDGMAGAAPMQMDLNDFDFDAYLANDRTLSDPEVVRVDPGGRVLLRVINAAAATVFWIDSGDLAGRLVAVDGQPVRARAGSRFGIAMGQRLDIAIDLPAGRGAWPVLALREGAVERAGLILATPGAHVPVIPARAEQAAPPFDLDLAQESALRAATALEMREADASQMVMLGGQMQPYIWTINGRVFEERIPVPARQGQRVELVFHNMSMMGHPMHLHGHHFQVVAVNDTRFAGALRDTVYVPPMSRVTVALDAGESAEWMLHCHHMPHLASGMMTTLAVRG